MKKILTLCLAIMLVFVSPVTVLASDTTDNSQLNHVTDDADILTGAEEAELEAFAMRVSRDYNCGIYILTVDDYTDYTNGSIRSFAEEIFNEYTLGIGDDRNGVMLVLSMEDRDYTFIAHGDIANKAFTDYGKDKLSEEFLDDFKNDEWYDGFYDFLKECDDYLQKSKDGHPVDVPTGPKTLVKVLITILVPLLIAGIVCLVFASQMKSVKVEKYAAAYITGNGLNLTGRQDIFIRETVHRTKIESSGGGTSVNSGGFSGKSGKF